MKIYAIFTEDTESLSEILLTSINKFGAGLEPIFVRSNLASGVIGSTEWDRVIDFKLDKIIETIEDRTNNYLV